MPTTLAAIEAEIKTGPPLGTGLSQEVINDFDVFGDGGLNAANKRNIVLNYLMQAPTLGPPHPLLNGVVNRNSALDGIKAAIMANPGNVAPMAAIAATTGGLEPPADDYLIDKSLAWLIAVDGVARNLLALNVILTNPHFGLAAGELAGNIAGNITLPQEDLLAIAGAAGGGGALIKADAGCLAAILGHPTAQTANNAAAIVAALNIGGGGLADAAAMTVSGAISTDRGGTGSISATMFAALAGVANVQSDLWCVDEILKHPNTDLKVVQTLVTAGNHVAIDGRVAFDRFARLIRSQVLAYLYVNSNFTGAERRTIELHLNYDPALIATQALAQAILDRNPSALVGTSAQITQSGANLIFAKLDDPEWYAYVNRAGIIDNDISSGVLGMTFRF